MLTKLFSRHRKIPDLHKEALVAFCPTPADYSIDVFLIKKICAIRKQVSTYSFNTTLYFFDARSMFFINGFLFNSHYHVSELVVQNNEKSLPIMTESVEGWASYGIKLHKSIGIELIHTSLITTTYIVNVGNLKDAFSFVQKVPVGLNVFLYHYFSDENPYGSDIWAFMHNWWGLLNIYHYEMIDIDGKNVFLISGPRKKNE